MDNGQNERESDGTTDRVSDTGMEPSAMDKAAGHVLLLKARDHFFDFILLFLAVFCGFMADNWRETMSEHQREKIFIRSIAEDISSDTLESEKTLTRLRMINTGIDSVLVALLDPSTIENSNEVFRLWTRNLGLEAFVSNDRTIQQLKSNGELRLIRKKEVSDRIMKYDQTLRKYYTQSGLMYNALTDLTYYSQLFDFISLSRNGNDPVPLTQQGRNMLNLAYSHLYLWKRGLEGLIGYLENVHTEGKELVTFIREQYRLKM
jgi:hypothetical protein